MDTSTLPVPNLVIAGVHKAGTTAVYSYLAKHPQICPSFTKEINHFLPLLDGREPPPLAQYASHFSHWQGERWRLEASPSYVYGRETIAERISAASPDARVLVILRDPVDRLVSFFSRAVASSVLPKELSFGEYVSRSLEARHVRERGIYDRGVREGFYIDYLEPWQQVFGASFRIFFFDELRADPRALTAQICTWLGLDAACYAREELAVENKTVHYRHRVLHRAVHRAYMATEPFWRRNYGLKRGLRAVYNRLNADTDRGGPAIDETTLSRLRALYGPYNERLKAFLEAHEYKALPAWLT